MVDPAILSNAAISGVSFSLISAGIAVSSLLYGAPIWPMACILITASPAQSRRPT